jgi:hypothetical protein
MLGNAVVIDKITGKTIFRVYSNPKYTCEKLTESMGIPSGSYTLIHEDNIKVPWDSMHPKMKVLPDGSVEDLRKMKWIYVFGEDIKSKDGKVLFTDKRTLKFDEELDKESEDALSNKFKLPLKSKRYVRYPTDEKLNKFTR